MNSFKESYNIRQTTHGFGVQAVPEESLFCRRVRNQHVLCISKLDNGALGYCFKSPPYKKIFNMRCLKTVTLSISGTGLKSPFLYKAHVFSTSLKDATAKGWRERHAFVNSLNVFYCSALVSPLTKVDATVSLPPPADKRLPSSQTHRQLFRLGLMLTFCTLWLQYFLIPNVDRFRCAEP